MEDIYGSDYFISENDSPKEYANIYWWIGDTVICASRSHIWYMYEEYFLEGRTQWAVYDEILDYFGKKNVSAKDECFYVLLLPVLRQKV